MQLLYKAAENLVRVEGLRSSFSGALIETATISARVYEEDGTTANGDAVTLTGSGGTFQAALPDDLALVIGSVYFLLVDIEASGLTDHRRIKCVCGWHQEIP